MCQFRHADVVLISNDHDKHTLYTMLAMALPTALASSTHSDLHVIHIWLAAAICRAYLLVIASACPQLCESGHQHTLAADRPFDGPAPMRNHHLTRSIPWTMHPPHR